MKMKRFALILFMYLFYGVVLICLVSCRSMKNKPDKVETTTTITITEVVHDTIFKIEADSSSYKALLECRENKVIIRTPQKSHKGTYLKAPKISIIDNLLAVDCDTQAQELLATWKSQNTTQKKETIVIKYLEVERALTWWQRWHIRLGKAFITIMVGGMVYAFFKLKKVFT